MKIYLALLLAVTFAAYSRSFYVPFMYDDDYSIAKNPSVNGWAPISIHNPRSVLMTTFRINYSLGGTDVFGYHVVNFALHVLNVLLVFRLLFVLVHSSMAALSGAALFSLHPLQSESVIYISARSELLSCFFGLLAMLAFEKKRYVWTIILMVMAIWSKEIALVFPVMIGLRVLLGRRTNWKRVGAVACLCLIVGALFTMRLEETERSLTAHAAIQAGQFVRFLGMVLIPINQTIDHDAETLSAAYCGVAIIVLCALGLLAISCAAEYKVAALGLGWMLLAVLPRFIVNTPEFMQEHHLYVPFIGIALLFSTIFNERNLYVQKTAEVREGFA